MTKRQTKAFNDYSIDLTNEHILKSSKISRNCYLENATTIVINVMGYIFIYIIGVYFQSHRIPIFIESLRNNR